MLHALKVSNQKVQFVELPVVLVMFPKNVLETPKIALKIASNHKPFNAALPVEFAI